MSSPPAIDVDYYAREGGGSPGIRDSMDYPRSLSGRFIRDAS
jgi:hypothetical protein